MITLTQIQTIMANSFFDGSLEMAGLIMFAGVLAVIFAIFHNNINVGILMTLPLVLIFRAMEVLNTEFTLLLIVVAVFTLAMTAKKTLGD